MLVKSKRMGNDLSGKHHTEESWCDSTNLRQSRLHRKKKKTQKTKTHGHKERLYTFCSLFYFSSLGFVSLFLLLCFFWVYLNIFLLFHYNLSTAFFFYYISLYRFEMTIYIISFSNLVWFDILPL